MDFTHYTTETRKGQHLNFEERMTIELRLKDGWNINQMLRFEMNPERDYLTIKIPVHPYFLPKSSSSKNAAYEKKILSLLYEKPRSMTELAIAMGYKGITAKLTRTVNAMLDGGVICKIIDVDNAVKLSVK